MSNQPPYTPGPGYPPPGQPPAGYGGQPPYGQPPYGQGYPPAPGQPYGMPPARPTNGWGIASLVFALIGCCTAVPSLLAVLFGFLGLRHSKRTGSGKGTAITGLILGLLGVAVYGIAGIWWVSMNNSTAANRALATQYITAIDQAAAASPTSTGGTPGGTVTAGGFTFDQAEVDDYKAAAAGGKMTDVWTYVTFAHGDQAVSQGLVTFSNGPAKNFQMMQERDAGGQWTVQGFQVIDPGKPVRPMKKLPTTRP